MMNRFLQVIAMLLSAIVPAAADPIAGMSSVLLDKHFLIGNRLLLAQWRCYDSADGVFVVAFDRVTLAYSATIRVAECDAEYQDSVSRIYARGDEIIAQIEFRYDSPDRALTAVIDAHSFTIKQVLNADEARAQGYLAAAGSDDDESQSSASVRIIARGGRPRQRPFVQRAGTDEPERLPCSDNLWDGGAQLLDQNHAILWMSSAEGLRTQLHLADLRKLTCDLIFEGQIWTAVPPSAVQKSGHLSNIVTVNGKVVFGFNRDLHIFSLRSREERVIRDVVPIGEVMDGSRPHLRRIERILVDPEQRRVLVFCAVGECNAYIPMADL